MKKVKKRAFSLVKAVKANARERVGTPPPERVLPDPKQKIRRARRKPTLEQLLESQD